MLIDEIQDDVIYEIKFLGTRILGKYLKQPHMRSFIVEAIKEKRQRIDYENRYYPDIHNQLVIRMSDNPDIYRISPSFDGIKQLAIKLELPSNSDEVYFSLLHSGARFFKRDGKYHDKFQKYAVERFGLKIKMPKVSIDNSDTDALLFRSATPMPDPAQYKHPPKYFEFFGGLHLVQIWRVRVFACPVESIKASPSNPLSPYHPDVMYFEECWHPRHGRRRVLRGLDNNQTAKITGIQEFTHDALKILGYARTRGREPGPSYYKSRDLFIQDMKDAYIKLSALNLHRPSQNLVAMEMQISASTFKKYKSLYATPWPPS